MNNNLVNEITARQLRNDVPDFRSGDTVSDDTPSHANESILRSGYLLFPAKRLPRS